MPLAEFLHSDPILALCGVLLTTVWSLAKSTDWFARLRERRVARALHVLEAGVDQAYRAYVEAVKEARADGKLTPAEKRRAREIARDRAFALARREGIDLLRTLGDEHIDLWIAKLVRDLKRGTN